MTKGELHTDKNIDLKEQNSGILALLFGTFTDRIPHYVTALLFLIFGVALLILIFENRIEEAKFIAPLVTLFLGYLWGKGSS